MESNYLNGYEKPICGHCGLKRTPEGYDGCLGTIPGVMNACCGHGDENIAYVQFNHQDYKSNPNKYNLRGVDAINYINDLQLYINQRVQELTKHQSE